MGEMGRYLEVVVPCCNEQECVRPLYSAIARVCGGMEGVSFSVLFVDDGSTDGTMSELRGLAEEEGAERVRYISLARNFGKEAAVYAGLSNSRGNYVAVMDADLQHPPELLPEMLRAIETEGYDCAGARRVSRKGEPRVRSLLSRAFYHLIDWATGMDLVPGMTDYRLMRRAVVEAIVSLGERERFIKGIYSWVGFRTKWLEYRNVERAAGKTKWSMRGLWNYAKIGFIAFANTPLRGVIYLGMVVVLVSLAYAIRVFYDATTGRRVWQDTTTIILLLLFLGGVIITTLGIIGEYLARIYMEVKRRPIYIARETNLPERPAIPES